ncbi:MAG: hypothetical protein M1385_01720 [Candidatus Marsarchaeota archaeon]|nr:hypothetical protein [Candidatus Marsarchaeota archaeon]
MATIQKKIQKDINKIIGTVMAVSALSMGGCSFNNNYSYTPGCDSHDNVNPYFDNPNIRYIRNVDEIFRNYNSTAIGVKLTPAEEGIPAFEGLNISLNNGKQYAWGVYAVGNSFAITLVKSDFGLVHYEYNILSVPKILPNDILDLSAYITNGFLDLSVKDENSSVSNNILIRSTATKIISNNEISGFTGISFILNTSNPKYLYPTNPVNFVILSDVKSIGIYSSNDKISLDGSQKALLRLENMDNHSVENLLLLNKEQDVECKDLKLTFSKHKFMINPRK